MHKKNVDGSYSEIKKVVRVPEQGNYRTVKAYIEALVQHAKYSETEAINALIEMTAINKEIPMCNKYGDFLPVSFEAVEQLIKINAALQAENDKTIPPTEYVEDKKEGAQISMMRTETI